MQPVRSYAGPDLRLFCYDYYTAASGRQGWPSGRMRTTQPHQRVHAPMQSRRFATHTAPRLKVAVETDQQGRERMQRLTATAAPRARARKDQQGCAVQHAAKLLKCWLRCCGTVVRIRNWCCCDSSAACQQPAPSPIALPHRLQRRQHCNVACESWQCVQSNVMAPAPPEARAAVRCMHIQIMLAVAVKQQTNNAQKWMCRPSPHQ